MAKTWENTKKNKNIVADYQKQIDTTIKNLTSQAETAQANNTATAEKNVANAYKTYAVGQTALDDNLKRQGITGGASETAKLNASNNLANVQAAYRNNALTNNTTIKNQLAQDIETQKLANESNKQTALSNAYSNWINEKTINYNKQQDKKNALNQKYALMAQGYTTLESIDKAIKNARKNGKTGLIPYLMAQRGAISQ